jgi:hypothetical protein
VKTRYECPKGHREDQVFEIVMQGNAGDVAVGVDVGDAS